MIKFNINESLQAIKIEKKYYLERLPQNTTISTSYLRFMTEIPKPVIWHPLKFHMTKMKPPNSSLKIYDNCNLTPQMVSYDKINITKIFVLKSYPKSCVLILMCRSIRKIPKICNVTPQMVSNDKICHFQVFPCEK